MAMCKQFALGLFAAMCFAAQADVIKVSSSAWEALMPAEQAAIKGMHLVDVRPAGSFGLVIDVQGLDESIPGSNAGSALGSSFAQAAYIDRAFKPGNNYSATNQLAIGILGAVIGSSMNRPTIPQYHLRYALKMGDGEIVYRDTVQSDPFRHAPGICLDLSSMVPGPQVLCRQTAADIRQQYLAATPPASSPIAAATPNVTVPPPERPALEKVECKAANVAPVVITADQCNAIGGKIL
jgi:hypothetical protein